MRPLDREFMLKLFPVSTAIPLANISLALYTAFPGKCSASFEYLRDVTVYLQEAGVVISAWSSSIVTRSDTTCVIRMLHLPSIGTHENRSNTIHAVAVAENHISLQGCELNGTHENIL